MASLCEVLEAFCWRCKIQAIWEHKPGPFNDILHRLHAEAAVFNAVYRCKNSTVPTAEKINQTIKFLEENDFWRRNSLSLFASYKDPYILRTVKILQTQEVRDIWNEKETSKDKEKSQKYSEQIQNDQVAESSIFAESKGQIVNNLINTKSCNNTEKQKSEITIESDGTNMPYYLQNGQFQSTSLTQVRSDSIPSNKLQIIEQHRNVPININSVPACREDSIHKN